MKKVLYSVESLAAISETKRKFRRLVEDRYGQRTLRFPNWDEMEIAGKINPTRDVPMNDFSTQLLGLLSVPPSRNE